MTHGPAAAQSASGRGSGDAPRSLNVPLVPPDISPSIIIQPDNPTSWPPTPKPAQHDDTATDISLSAPGSLGAPWCCRGPERETSPETCRSPCVEARCQQCSHSLPHDRAPEAGCQETWQRRRAPAADRGVCRAEDATPSRARDSPTIRTKSDAAAGVATRPGVGNSLSREGEHVGCNARSSRRGATGCRRVRSRGQSITSTPRWCPRRGEEGRASRVDTAHGAAAGKGRAKDAAPCAVALRAPL